MVLRMVGDSFEAQDWARRSLANSCLLAKTLDLVAREYRGEGTYCSGMGLPWDKSRSSRDQVLAGATIDWESGSCEYTS